MRQKVVIQNVVNLDSEIYTNEKKHIQKSLSKPGDCKSLGRVV